MITIIALIFLNLGERKPGKLSIYSVFNPNQERILGNMSPNVFGLVWIKFMMDLITIH
jgi:hypothetical protein